MSEQKHFIQTAVAIDELTEGMIIREFTELDSSSLYRMVGASTLAFLQKNFEGAQATIFKNGEQQNVPIDRLEVGDRIQKIHTLPPELKKLTIVTDKLVRALQSRGFAYFKVKRRVNLPSGFKKDFQEILSSVAFKKQRVLSQNRKKYKIQQGKAKELVQRVQENIEVHQDATETIESFMDAARGGRIDPKEIVSYIDKIAKSSSSEAMAAMISLKESDQTYAHCVDVAAIFQVAYFEIVRRSGYKSVFSDRKEALLGGFLHDFGKANVPKDILDSTERFERDSREMKLMKSHPEEGAKLLEKMNMPEVIINMAHFHHVKKDTNMRSSYPVNQTFNHVIFETKLLALSDTYQALIGRRKYKKPWTPPAAMRYLEALAGIEYDLTVWNLFLKTMGIYPRGSLVELSEGSLGFVMNIPESDLERPSVAIVRNPDGGEVGHHTLIDLEEEKEIAIIKDLNPFEVLGEDVLNKFIKINFQ